MHRQEGEFNAASDAGYSVRSTYSDLNVPGQAPFSAGWAGWDGYNSGPYAGAGNVEMIKGNQGSVFFDAKTPASITDVSDPTNPANSLRFIRQDE